MFQELLSHPQHVECVSLCSEVVRQNWDQIVADINTIHRKVFSFL